MSNPMVQVIDVHKSFGGVKVLDGVNLTIEEGTTCALMGLSGSGKTTLLKHIEGLLTPDRGEIWVDGRNLTELSERELQELRKHTGILFQSGALFDSLTVYDNVAFPLQEQLHLPERDIVRRVAETLVMLGLAGTEHQLPDELSGGMRKRVAFARAIVTHPRLLLYDDPTAGLDPLRTQTVADEILFAKRELHLTQLAVTADLPTAFRIADEVAVIDAGRIVAHLPPAQLHLSQHPVVQGFLHRWMEREDSARAGFTAQP